MTSPALPLSIEERGSLGGITDDDCIHVNAAPGARFFDPGAEKCGKVGTLFCRKTRKRRHSSIGTAVFEEGAQFLAAHVL